MNQHIPGKFNPMAKGSTKAGKSAATTTGNAKMGGVKNAHGKIPRAKDILVRKAAKPKTKATSRLPVEATVIVTIYKYTDSAEDFMNGAMEDHPIYQVMIAHEARPSAAYNMIYRMNSFLDSKHQKGSLPETKFSTEERRRERLRTGGGAGALCQAVFTT